jgi:Fucose 4-O-acetylase and related acetyltransferases
MSEISLSSPRFDFIDNAKMIAILGVVFEHTRHYTDFPVWLSHFIGAYQMPLFFFISGYLISQKRMDDTFLEYLHHSAKTLLVPLYIFAFPFIVLSVYRMDVHTMLLHLTGVNSPYWFFMALFLSQIFYRVLFGAVKNQYILLLVCFAISYASTFIFSSSTYFVLPQTFVALFFVALGGFVRRKNYSFNLNGKSMIAGLVLILPLLLFSSYYVGDMYVLAYGNIHLLFFLRALVGVSGILFLSCNIAPNSTFQWLSKNTLYIFPLQLYPMMLLTKVSKVMNFPLLMEPPIFYIIAVLSAILLGAVAKQVLTRILPSVFPAR